MKKIVIIVFAMATLALSACGKSAKEKEIAKETGSMANIPRVQITIDEKDEKEKK